MHYSGDFAKEQKRRKNAGKNCRKQRNANNSPSDCGWQSQAATAILSVNNYNWKCAQHTNEMPFRHAIAYTQRMLSGDCDYSDNAQPAGKQGSGGFTTKQRQSSGDFLAPKCILASSQQRRQRALSEPLSLASVSFCLKVFATSIPFATTAAAFSWNGKLRLRMHLKDMQLTRHPLPCSALLAFLFIIQKFLPQATNFVTNFSR